MLDDERGCGEEYRNVDRSSREEKDTKFQNKEI